MGSTETRRKMACVRCYNTPRTSLSTMTSTSFKFQNFYGACFGKNWPHCHHLYFFRCACYEYLQLYQRIIRLMPHASSNRTLVRRMWLLATTVFHPSTALLIPRTPNHPMQGCAAMAPRSRTLTLQLHDEARGKIALLYLRTPGSLHLS